MSYLFAGVELGQVRDAQVAAKTATSTSAASMTVDKSTLEFQRALANLGAYKGPLDGVIEPMADIRNALRSRFGLPKLTSRAQPIDKVDNEALNRLIALASKPAATTPVVTTTRPTVVSVQQATSGKPPPSAATAAAALPMAVPMTATATPTLMPPSESKLPGWVLPAAGAVAVWFLFLRK